MQLDNILDGKYFGFYKYSTLQILQDFQYDQTTSSSMPLSTFSSVRTPREIHATPLRAPFRNLNFKLHLVDL